MSKKNISRRAFLGQASCAAIGSTTLLSTLLNLGMSNSLAAKSNLWYGPNNNDYRAMVCILLAGGNDSYNMLIPRGTNEYDEYAMVRSNLAIPQQDILPIVPTTNDGKQYGVHPAMPEVQQLFSNGKLAFLSNVGTLVEPTTLASIQNLSANLPLGLMSHADQIRQWQTSVPNDRSSIGWGGKAADILSSLNTNQNISMNISLGGRNVFQSGNNTTEFAISPFGTGSSGITGYNGPGTLAQIATTAVDNILDQTYQDIFKQTYVDVARDAQTGHEQFSTALAGVNPFQTVTFSPGYISQSFQMIARTIAARNVLGMNRQTFFIVFGGWDHHDEILNNQTEMLGVLSAGLSEFQTALEELMVEDCVTTFTISDFARTLTSNGNGTDHAWGGNAMVMGGAVNGGDIYGNYPDLGLGNSQDVGDGVLIPTTSTDEYFAELALWFGVQPGELSAVLPNIGAFYNTGSGVPPIGFMQP